MWIELGQFVFLVEGQLVSDVDMEGVPGERVFGVEADERRRPDIDSLVVVGQFQAGKEALDQGRFARALRSQDTDHEVGRSEVFLGQLGRDQIQAVAAARRVVRRIDEGFPVDRPLRIGLHHRPPP
ncbi:MAG: hypothetical protein MZW92_01560 [Comamonadaceae bacterium]|nr:hypothetical protein [Comamonadaceae bacterium]